MFLLPLATALLLLPPSEASTCSVDSTHQAALALPGTWVLDTNLSDLLCGDCSLPHPTPLPEEDHEGVVGFQQLLQPNSLMVVVDALPAAMVASYSYWMCPALPPSAALLSTGNLTLHVLGDSANYSFLLAALGRHLQLTFWSGTAPPSSPWSTRGARGPGEPRGPCPRRPRPGRCGGGW